MKNLPLLSLFSIAFISGCVPAKKPTTMQQFTTTQETTVLDQHRQIATQFWQKNGENLTNFFTTYEGYNKGWTHKLTLEKQQSKIILSNVIEAKVTNDQRGHINQMMEDYNISELSIKMGQKDYSITYDFMFTTTETNTEESLFTNSSRGYEHTYVPDDKQDFTVDLVAYPFSKANTNPEKVRVKIHNQNGEVLFYMPTR